ncbi:O-methyltransferase [Acidipropionibacterium virtanenii]|uniref:O-methyltransferase n=1 Tax=Acidipropionibacterium virtanenii TaxID=2057246 RepID=A0A344UVK7_9ACTN|nr:class I SAM-dependent methyltransferase [Acidipropionibacterium virtanenii]AXE39305.1 Putative O-methyltransferase [Acidipropionibacterium virtanenii]
MSPDQLTPTAPDPRSWEYADEFVATSPEVSAARETALAAEWSPVGTGTASLLTFMSRAIDAHTVVEIGTDAGVTGLSLMQGMDRKGVLTSIDAESDRQAAARVAFERAGMRSNQFRLITGMPLDVLPKLRDGAYDLVLVNGDRLEYVEYVAQALRLLRHGGVVVVNGALADNTIADPDNDADETLIIREALDSIQETEEFRPVLLPVGSGLLLAIKE